MTDVAVVGIGNWGQNLVRTFDAVASVPICCHTGRAEHAAWLADEYPTVEVTTDYEAVLADDRVDAVAIATPIPTLAELAERALEADKHVYVEKPMAQTRAAADRLVERAETRDRVLFVGYIFVHHPVFARLRELVASDGLRRLRLDWQTEGSFEADIVTDLVCHPVSIAVALAGVPSRVDVISTLAATGGVDVLECRLGYEAVDCEVTVTVNRLSPQSRYALTVVTDAGETYVATDDAVYAYDDERGGLETIFEPDVEPLALECRAFRDAVDGERPVATDGAFGVDVLEVLERIEADVSAGSGVRKTE